MNNLDLYNEVRSVPQEAQKTIRGGRINGMTDINPMWRIKTLTEQFGVCGVGWKYEITRQWLETGANGEMSAFTNINLYIKVNNEWSDAIPGTGGSSFITNESRGLYVSDECYKMALTDAISVACKALGMGADIYWGNDRTKYAASNSDDDNLIIATQQANEAKTLDELQKVWGRWKAYQNNKEFIEHTKKIKSQLLKNAQNENGK